MLLILYLLLSLLQYIDITDIVHLVIVLTVLVSLLCWMVPALEEQFIGASHAVWNAKERYRMLTSGLLHGSFVHLLLNMYALHAIGAAFLATVATSPHREHWFLITYFGGVLTANAIASWRHADDHQYRYLGASAGICALLASYIALAPFRQMGLLFWVLPSWIYLALFFAFSLLARHARSTVGHDAHLTGLIYGILLAAVMDHQRVWHNLIEWLKYTTLA